MSASSNYLIQKHKDAIKRGRAIPLLVDYQPPEIPHYTLTVYGLIDSCSFDSVLLHDDFNNEKVIPISIPRTPKKPIPEIKIDSEDAKAVHTLWALWNGGAREDYLRFTKTLGLLISHSEVMSALNQAIANKKTAASRASSKPDRKARKGVAKARRNTRKLKKSQ